MKPVKVTISPDERYEHEPQFRIKKSPQTDYGVLRTLRNSKRGKSSSPGTSSTSSKLGILQQVVVKARVVKTGGERGARNLRAHVSYLKRSGTSIDGEEPEIFLGNEELKPTGVAKEWGQDNHHFRFIVSPEKGAQLNLPEYVKRVMQGVSEDLATPLEWFSVCHYNTDNPHAHVVVRGRKPEGSDLVISKEYISNGFRNRAQLEATRELGSRTVGELKSSLDKAVTASRYTGIDQKISELLVDSKDNVLTVPSVASQKNERAVEERGRLLGRLSYLKGLGLASEGVDGRWKLEADFKQVLRKMGEKGDIIKSLHQCIKDPEKLFDLKVYDKDSPPPEKLTGRVIRRAPINELSDTMSLVVEGTDGATHYVPLSEFSETSGFEGKVGSIVRIEPPPKRATDSVFQKIITDSVEPIVDYEKLVSKIKGEVEGGKWKLPGELKLSEYCERFKARLVSLEKMGAAKKLDSSRWYLAKNFQDVAREYEKNFGGKVPQSKVVKLSGLTLLEQTESSGLTWLDELIEAKRTGALKLVEQGFGFEVAESMKIREAVLKERGIEIDASFIDKIYDNAIYQTVRNSKYTMREGRVYEEFTGTFERYVLVGDKPHIIVRRDKDLVIGLKHPKAQALVVGEEYGFRVSVEKTSTRKSKLNLYLAATNVTDRTREKEQGAEGSHDASERSDS